MDWQTVALTFPLWGGALLLAGAWWQGDGLVLGVVLGCMATWIVLLFYAGACVLEPIEGPWTTLDGKLPVECRLSVVGHE